MDPYTQVAKGKLKLKGDNGIKKKKKCKDKNKIEKIQNMVETEEKQEKPKEKVELKRTKAEIAFKKMQEKMVSNYLENKNIKT